MGVGAPDGTDPAVQHEAHGQLLGSGLRVDLHQNDFRMDLLQDLIDQQEGVVGTVVHIAPADEIDHRHIPGVCLKDPPSPAGDLGRIVGRPEDPGTVVQVGHDLPLSPGVVSQGDDIRSRVQDLLRLIGCQPHHSGILAVDHREVHAVFPFDLPKASPHPFQAGISHHVAYRQYLKLHRVSLHVKLFPII